MMPCVLVISTVTSAPLNADGARSLAVTFPREKRKMEGQPAAERVAHTQRNLGHKHEDARDGDLRIVSADNTKT